MGPPPGVPAGPPPGVPGGPAQGVPGGPPAGAMAPGTDSVSGALNVAAFGRDFAKNVHMLAAQNLAIWFIDVRNFRSINPQYGYEVGNEVLKSITRSIRSCLSHELPVARLGGDRFIVLTAGVTADTLDEGFSKLSTRVEEEARRLGIRHPVMLAAGVYMFRDDDYENPNMQRAIDYASIAHRNAHSLSQANVTAFTDEDLRRDQRRITIEQDIDVALAEGQIEVWYQPQVDYTYGEIIGAEALARWHHPELGWISPKEFIPVLERCGKVHDLDLFVWEKACRSAGRWHSVADGKPVPISVNVSRYEMYEAGLMEHFLELQQRYNLPEGSLRLEVTESAFVEEADRLYGVIERMREHKMLVEMDDFGSGLSSLNMLKDVPVDVVKLDMGFLRSAMGEERGGVVLGSVIRMLQGLDTPIIAEGVETLEQAEMLKNMGCHLMQGYHFSRPMPRADFEDYVASNRAVERTSKRDRVDSHLEELLGIDASSSYLFNHAVGGMMFFFAGQGVSESILVNDQFYRECGLDRGQFGDGKVNPIQEVDPASRATMWRAAAEAHEVGAATCRAEVLLTKRWIDCVIRYMGPSSRGEIYSISIIRSGEIVEEKGGDVQEEQDATWFKSNVDAIATNGFMKCALDDSLSILYMSAPLFRASGLTRDEFARFFHNSFLEVVVPEDQQILRDAIAEGMREDGVVSCSVRARRGYGADQSRLQIAGRVREDGEGNPWLYLFIMVTNEMAAGEEEAANEGTGGVAFAYDIAADRLTLRPAGVDDADATVVEGWTAKMGSLPDTIAAASAAKLLATVRDLRSHPSSGFVDIKCNLEGGADLSWYHVNYSCVTDEEGEATAIEGFARSALDQMGSARWWRQQAETDQLTGLLNRNAVEQEINLAMRTQGSGMMFMVDLDGFKRINDELGHLMGDTLLRDVATALKGAFREGDIVGRYGGDEFVAFMAITGGDERRLAAMRSERIITAITGITASDGRHAACSVGVAICHDPEASFYDLLEVADQVMYESKEAGKGTFTIRVMD